LRGAQGRNCPTDTVISDLMPLLRSGWTTLACYGMALRIWKNPGGEEPRPRGA